MSLSPTITIEHIRGLMSRTPNSVLLYDRDASRIVFATPEAAGEKLLSGGFRFLLSRNTLLEDGVARTQDGSLAAGSLARARELVDELNELVDDGGAGIVAA